MRETRLKNCIAKNQSQLPQHDQGEATQHNKRKTLGKEIKKKQVSGACKSTKRQTQIDFLPWYMVTKHFSSKLLNFPKILFSYQGFYRKVLISIKKTDQQMFP